jgi:hypothetical protein
MELLNRLCRVRFVIPASREQFPSQARTLTCFKTLQSANRRKTNGCASTLHISGYFSTETAIQQPLGTEIFPQQHQIVNTCCNDRLGSRA